MSDPSGKSGMDAAKIFLGKIKLRAALAYPIPLGWGGRTQFDSFKFSYMFLSDIEHSLLIELNAPI
jgi:hypothetical protein